MRIVRFGVATLIILYACLCTALFLNQRSLLYFPVARAAGNAELLTLTAGEDRVLVSTRPRSSADALIYFGGNAEDVSWNLPHLSRTFPASALYLMHYRGFGGSTGEPSEAALFADALTLYDKVQASHPNIVVVGRSLGSGVAVYVASQRPVRRLVLVTPYDSIEGIAEQRFPYAPVSWLLLDKYESWKYAPRVTAPTSILAAEFDQVVPRESTEALRSRFRDGLVRYIVVPGADHISISNRAEYWDLWKNAP